MDNANYDRWLKDSSSPNYLKDDNDDDDDDGEGDDGDNNVNENDVNIQTKIEFEE